MFLVIHLVQKMSDSDTICWEINEKGFGDRFSNRSTPYRKFLLEMKYTPNEQLSYEVLTACSFGNAITILGLYRNISKLLHYS